MTANDSDLVKVKFPWLSLSVATAYEIVALSQDFGSRDWFARLRPDVLIGHTFGGRFAYDFGLWLSYKTGAGYERQKWMGRASATIAILGVEGVQNLVSDSVPDVLDAAGGVVGAYTGEVSHERRYISRFFKSSKVK